MSDQAKADTINSLLPVSVSKEDVANNPDFVKLLLNLSKHIRPDGLTHTRAKELKIAKAKMETQKAEQISMATLDEAVESVIIEHQNKNLHGSETIQGIEELDKFRTEAQVSEYLHPYVKEDGTSDTLLNLDPVSSSSSKELWQLAERVRPLVEQELDYIAEQLLDLVKTQDSDATIDKLPSLLGSWKSELEENRKKLEQDVRRREQCMWKYFEGLLQRWEILNKVLEYVDKEELYIVSQIQDFSNANETFAAKAKVQECVVLNDTYDRRTIEALRALRKVLTAELKEISDKSAKVKSGLHGYEACGPELNSLVKQYAALQKQLQNKRWVLSEMSKAVD